MTLESKGAEKYSKNKRTGRIEKLPKKRANQDYILYYRHTGSRKWYRGGRYRFPKTAMSSARRIVNKGNYVVKWDIEDSAMR